MLGLTNYDQLHSDWIRFAANLSNPHSDENIQLVIEALRDAREKSAVAHSGAVVQRGNKDSLHPNPTRAAIPV